MTDVVETDATPAVDDATSSPVAPDVPQVPTDGFVAARPMEDDVEALFAGDTGVLPFPARRALALVLQRRYVSAAAHPAEWKALLAHQNVLASRCHDLFVELVVDRDYEIAYKRQVREDGLSVPVLLKDEPYKRVETLLMLLARNRFRQEQGAGERTALLDAEELVDYASGFLAQDETNLAARRREIDNAVATLVREHVLTEVATGRYRVEPVVEILLPVERLRELTAWLRDGGAATDAGPDAGADTEAVDEDEETSA
ncbi:uncharacterized protein DUF4194 [Isoptericola jiangsuensis]|uniref:Uncharacterized protein DUF4194 n=1 Tax=Isoptericola jiangsuensis TaxID=548579 RepID=A0A2A9EYP0_9MICO|nr:DUF4194 domain-containing protein [Isoptericola jiangsuensis]PFG43661.1 uncharacterized protein DUF4194 [Isoptericola jiangsuensis]